MLQIVVFHKFTRILEMDLTRRLIYFLASLLIFLSLGAQNLYAQQSNSLDKLLSERSNLYQKYESLKAVASKNKKNQAEFEQVNYQLLQKDAEIIALIKDLQNNYSASLKRAEILGASLKLQDKKNRQFLVQIIDSLETMTKMQKNVLDSLDHLYSLSNSEIASSEENLALLNDNYIALSNNYSSLKDHAAELEKHNKQMIIYIAIVGIVLLSLLIYYIAAFIRRRKRNVSIEASADHTIASYKPITGFSSAAYTSNITNVLDVKLEQIEKLGKLRDKGLISDQEFDAQKQQILKD